AIVGALPVSAGLLVRTEAVRRTVSAETSKLVARLVGVDASYSVRVQLFPIELVLEDVSVRASDGGSPALSVHRIAVTPRLFSLLAGRVDAGDIEIEAPRARLVVADGKLTNVKYLLPESSGKTTPLERSPFASLSLTDASVDVDVDGVHAVTGPVDLDVLAEPGLAFEISLRVGESRVTRIRKTPDGDAVDEDLLCELDTRARVEQSSVLVRRLSVLGAADTDAKPGTWGRCRLGDTDAGRVALRLSEVRLTLDDAKPVLANGHVILRAPLGIANRFVKGPFRGWVSAAADVRWDKKADLPEVHGKLRGGGIEMSFFKFAKDFDADIDIVGNEIRAHTLHATYGHASVTIEDVTLRPLAPGIPLRVRRADTHGLRFPDLMEWNDVTPDTIVDWSLDRAVVTEFAGTIDPLKLDGDVYSETSGFEIYDRAYHDANRKHVIGVKAATVRTRFGVRPDSVQFMNSRASFGSSELLASVSVGFHNDIRLSVPKGSKLRLADISPLVDIPMDGTAELSVAMAGKASQAELTGDLSIRDFLFAGFPIGDIESSHVKFKPLVLDLTDVRGVKGTSRFVAPTARIDFDKKGAVLVNADVRSDRLDLRDFFAMFHFDDDPRFDKIAGRGVTEARVEYDLGGPRDRCGGGYLRVDGRLGLKTADLFEEHYDSGEARFDFRWMDQAASHLGMLLDAPSVTLKKGDGTILGSVKMSDGAALRAHLVASGVPLSHLDFLGDLGHALEGRVNAVAEVGGTLDAMTADVDAHIGSIRAGRATLPGSDLRVHLEPTPPPPRPPGKTHCGRPVPGPLDPADYAADKSSGVFHATGQLFGGQVSFTDLAVTRQRTATIRGDVLAKSLDLGALSELSPAAALSEQRLEGRLSAKMTLRDLSLSHPGFLEASLGVEELRLGRRGFRVELEHPAKLEAARGRLEGTGFTVAMCAPTGECGLFDVKGGIENLGGAPKVGVMLALRPTDLAALSRFVPQADRVAGTLAGQLGVNGTWPKLVTRGRFTLTKGELALKGAPVTLTDMDVAVAIDSDEVRIERAKASVGGGTLDVRGSLPLSGLTLGAGRAAITARNVSLPLMDGARGAADADLALAWQPSRADAGSGERTLPKLTGDVTVRSFRYTRKMTVAADLDSLTKRGHRTRFESYDPENDVIDFDVRIRAPRPLEIDNDLVEAKLALAEPGLELSGTNQRFGVRGELDIGKGGRIRLRRNQFEITQGVVRFDDDERIAPRVDVTAVTEYHRYDDTLAAPGAAAPGSSGAGASGSGASGATAGGRWRITMHAYGDADTLRVDLTSEPALSQDDIFLLLTLGLTRAELDRAQSATAGGSVALEALGTLTGADEVVTETIPVIDEFKLGSAYSSRTGRTEPTVTIGKRLAQRIRAYVTSGLSESREVRSNLEWRLSPKVSVEGSYDNVNDISSSSLGNLGADVRFRLEFK
ncbi:MAG TPA: translocation/assembly module TamB domain-containing protein, partial [Polyangiaceae bacterium]